MARRFPRWFDKFIKIAEKLLSDLGKLLDKMAKADQKADKERGKIEEVLEDLKALIRMVRAWAKGEYKEAPTTTIVLAIAAVIYFLSPIDAIPDLTPIIGYTDDALIITLVVAGIKSDLDNFRAWEKKNKR